MSKKKFLYLDLSLSARVGIATAKSSSEDVKSEHAGGPLCTGALGCLCLPLDQIYMTR